MATPQEINYLNDRIRPRAEQIRGLQALIRDDLSQWTALGMATGEDDIADGGKPFTRDDAHTFKARLQSLADVLSAPIAMPIVHKACVRPLHVVQGG